MKMSAPLQSSVKAFCLALIALASASLSANAATYTWSDSGADWGTGANWGGSAPGSSDWAFFNTASYTNQPTISGTQSLTGLRMGSSSGAVTISGGLLDLGAGGIYNGILGLTGSAASGSPTISGVNSSTSVAQLNSMATNGQSLVITGTGAVIPGGTTISSGAGTTLTLSANATGNSAATMALTVPAGSTNQLTINSNVNVSASQQWSTASGIVSIGGNLTSTSAAQTITISSTSSNSTVQPNLRLSGTNSGFTGTLTFDAGTANAGLLLGSPSAQTGGLLDLSVGNRNLWLTSSGSSNPYTFVTGTAAIGGVMGVNFRNAGSSGLFLTGGDVYWNPTSTGNNYVWDLARAGTNGTIRLNGSDDATPRMLYFGNTSGNLVISNANKSFNNGTAGNNPALMTMLFALSDDNESTARTLTSDLNMLVLTRAAVNVHATNMLRMAVSGGALAISNVNQLPGGNLSLSGNGVLVLDGISWSTFTGARTSGTGNGQFQLSGSSGFAARTSGITIDTTQTSGTTFDRNFTIGSAALGTDGNIYANAPVTISRDTTLSGNRIITVNGGVGGDTSVHTISGNLSGVSGGVTKSGGAILKLSGSNTYGAGATLSAGTLQIGVAPVGSVGSITSSALGTGTTTLTAGTISSDGATARDILNPWVLNGNTAFGDTTNSGELTFKAGGAITGTAARTATVNSNVIFEGTLSGTNAGAGLTKAGNGVLTLSGSNSYTGSTTISAGTLRVTTPNAIVNSGSLTLNADATLDLRNDSSTDFAKAVRGNAATGNYTINVGRAIGGSGTNQTHTIGAINNLGGSTSAASLVVTGSNGYGLTTGAVTFNTNSNTNGTRTLTNNATGLLTLASLTASASSGAGSVTLNAASGDITITGPLTATSSAGVNVTKTGGGLLTLSGSNAFAQGTSGLLTINAGRLLVNNAGALSTGTTNFMGLAVVTGTADINGFSPTIRTLALGGTSAAAGSISLVTTGTGTLNLTSDVTYTANNSNDNGGGTINGNLALGSTNRTFTVADSGGAATDLTVGATVSGSAGIIKAGAGVMVLSNSNSYTGATTVNSGKLDLQSAGAISSGTTVTVAGGLLTQTAANAITGAATTVTLTSGTAVLSQSNNYGGTTTINGGLLTVGNDSALGSGTLSFNNGGSGTIQSATDRVFSNPLLLNTGIGNTATIGAGGSMTFGAMTLTANSGNNIKVDSSRLTVPSSSNDGSARTLLKSGTGSLFITGNAGHGGSTVSEGLLAVTGTYTSTGNMKLDGGVLGLNGSLTRSFGASASQMQFLASGGFAGTGTSASWGNSANNLSVTISGGGLNWAQANFLAVGNSLILGHADANGTATFTNAINLSGTAADNGIRSILVNRSATAGASDVDGVLSGVLSGGGGLAKDGLGVLSVTGSNTYTGATQINAGTFLANNSAGSATGSGDLTVSASAKLGGAGTISGAVDIAGGGILAPGNSAGTLATGALTLANTTVLQFELTNGDFTIGGGINDLVDVTGNLTLDGTLEITALGGTLADGTYRLFNYTGSLTNNTLVISSAFLATNPGSSIDFGTAGQINLLVVPEPSTVLMLLGSTAGVFFMRRRRSI